MGNAISKRDAEMINLRNENRRLIEELDWIDTHLFVPVDITASRKFVAPGTPEGRRLERICDLLEAEQALKGE